MSTATENIETLRAYPLATGAESEARANVDKLRSLAPSQVIATARRIIQTPTIGAPLTMRAGHPVIVGPVISAS